MEQNYHMGLMTIKLQYSIVCSTSLQMTFCWDSTFQNLNLACKNVKMPFYFVSIIFTEIFPSYHQLLFFNPQIWYDYQLDYQFILKINFDNSNFVWSPGSCFVVCYSTNLGFYYWVSWLKPIQSLNWLLFLACCFFKRRSW